MTTRELELAYQRAGGSDRAHARRYDHFLFSNRRLVTRRWILGQRFHRTNTAHAVPGELSLGPRRGHRGHLRGRHWPHLFEWTFNVPRASTGKAMAVAGLIRSTDQGGSVHGF